VFNKHRNMLPFFFKVTRVPLATDAFRKNRNIYFSNPYPSYKKQISSNKKFPETILLPLRKAQACFLIGMHPFMNDLCLILDFVIMYTLPLRIYHS
jgi:hypothetical protein